MSHTPRRMTKYALCWLLTAAASFGQSITGAGGNLAGTWSGIFAMANPDRTVSHNQVVVRLELHGSKVTGGIGSTIDNQSAFADGQVAGNVIRFHLTAGRVTEFRLRLSKGHLYGHAVGTGVNRLEHADLDLQPAPALLPHAELVAEISAADREAFEAYQACDLSRYASFLSYDLEFYQDNLGVRNRSQILRSMKSRCTEGIRLRRQLDEKTVVINAVPGYDAVEAGTHEIYSTHEGGSEHLDSTVRFVHIWTKKTGSWQLIRVISFDHR